MNMGVYDAEKTIPHSRQCCHQSETSHYHHEGSYKRPDVALPPAEIDCFFLGGNIQADLIDHGLGLNMQLIFAIELIDNLHQQIDGFLTGFGITRKNQS